MQPLRDGTRQVRRLRVRAANASLAGRAQNLLADALRTATLPDRAGRLLFVRRMKLARFDADVASQSLALMIEREFVAIEQQAVHAFDTRAVHAPAVWFRDQLEAHVALALRLVDDAPLEAWFWPRVVPAIAHAHDRHSALRAVVLALAQTETAAAALPALVCALETPHRMAMLVESLRSADLPVLYAASGIAANHAEAKALPALPAQAGASSLDGAAARVLRLPQALRVVAAQLGVPHDDARLRWIAAMLPREAGLRLREANASDATMQSHDSAPTPSVVERNKDAGAGPASVSAHVIVPSAIAQAKEMPQRQNGDAPRIPENPGEPLNIYMPLEQPPWPSGAPTAAGGLLFLLRVLALLGYAEWLEQEEQWRGRSIPMRLLRQVCLRLRLADEDPAWRLAIVDENDPQAEVAAAQWLNACRRWLRREARIGVATLVMRPARLTLTPTHADTTFDMQQLNLAVRRRGLDIDLGWVAWYGRVVSFHYAQEL